MKTSRFLFFLLLSGQYRSMPFYLANAAKIIIQSLLLTLCYAGSIANLFSNLEIWYLCFRHRRSGFWISGLTLISPLPVVNIFLCHHSKTIFHLKSFQFYLPHFTSIFLNLGLFVESVRPLHTFQKTSDVTTLQYSINSNTFILSPNTFIFSPFHP